MKKNTFINLYLVLIPYFILAPYVFKFIEVGNDFELYYFTYKKYIFEFFRIGIIPFWSPAEASGYSLIFNPLSQFFYLPSWIFYIFCLVIGELSKYSFLVYTIFAISIFNIGLYKFLKDFKINYKVIICTIFITCLSLKVTELLRFPNALHSLAWFPWVLHGINLAIIKNESKKSFFVIFFSTLMLFTAGYPYYIFYGFILSSVYFIFIFLNNKKNLIFNCQKDIIEKKYKFFLKCLYPSLLSLLFSLPWLLKVSQLMSITDGRDQLDYNFSLNLSSNLVDQLGSWIFPPFANTEGWYYFGALSVMLIITSLLITFVKEKEKTQFYQNKFILILLIFLLFFTYQFSNPKDSLIFRIFWDNLDFIQNFRFWIRINVILVPIISLALAISLNLIIMLLKQREILIRNKILEKLFIIFIVIILLQIYFIFFSNYENNYWDTWHEKRINYAIDLFPYFLKILAASYNNFLYPFFFTISFLLIFFIFRNKKLNIYLIKNSTKICFIFAIIVFTELFFLTNIQWAIPYRYYDTGFKNLNLKVNYNSFNEDPLLDLQKAFNASRISIEKSGNNHYEGNTYYRNNKKFNINHISNWGNKNHVQIFKKYFKSNGEFKEDLEKNTIKNVKYFFGLDKSAKKLFFSNKIDHLEINDFISDSIKKESESEFNSKVSFYNGNEVQIIISTSQSGWLTYIDTWDPNWTSTVNNENVKMNKLFQAYKSVFIKKGISTVKFTYKPFNLNFDDLF
ncbi:hypothetical protein [Candidatus Pelagibacter communis]|uniref:hypothetical protein n=1 Tax=Candidatus Pelagibacter TaxID=198251 RepID=UPI003EDF0B45